MCKLLLQHLCGKVPTQIAALPLEYIYIYIYIYNKLVHQHCIKLCLNKCPIIRFNLTTEGPEVQQCKVRFSKHNNFWQ